MTPAPRAQSRRPSKAIANSAGASGIVDPDGSLVAALPAPTPGLLVAEIETAQRKRRRGWDSGTNPHVAEAYRGLSEEWRTP